MLKSSVHLQPTRLSEAAINASRQVWLASLGAAVVTRDWVQKIEADGYSEDAMGAVQGARQLRGEG